MKNPVWKIQLDKLDFCLFRTWILQATQAVKIKLEIDKKSSSSHLIFQTRFFKNQVLINRGNGVNLIFLTDLINYLQWTYSLFPPLWKAGIQFFAWISTCLQCLKMRNFPTLEHCIDKWYFVTKIVLTYCERKAFEIRGWRQRIFKNFEITRTIHSNS